MDRTSYYDEPERQTDAQLRTIPVYCVQEKFMASDEVSFTHTCRHIWPVIFGLVFLATSSYGVGFLVKTYEVDPSYGNVTMSVFREEQVLGEQCRAVDHAVPWKELSRKIRQCRRFEYYDPMHNDCQACPAPQPTDKVFAVFWETQSNCQHLVGDPNIRFVTHVMWSFSTLRDDGSVEQKLQYWDDNHIMDCIAQLRMRCIKSIVALGGADNRNMFFGLRQPENLQRFVSSAVTLVKKYGFDGVDIDDETANMIINKGKWKDYHGQTVVDYLTALRKGLDQAQLPDEPRYILSWDEFPQSWTKSDCELYNYDDGWHRCWEPRIADIVDFINIMFYNMYGFPTFGNPFLDLMATHLPALVLPAIKDPKKIILGACSGQGCVLPQPDGQEVMNAGNGSAFYGGTMLWSATIDILHENSSCLRRMGRTGNYGVKMPFRAPHP
ncbi:hypothetical protein H310_00225 [Aphanomyces invadans]|uniref:GH18 domain-containing protein n=1 Tax=Aphanomyces invadans TaxID=157072 RepID=A0A024UT91_9STRA|nr:hypothetical protein H310_00225 [Aphanomyces invadans]ETW09736.1 hypothetical protein H310_00225 [Aphanomyces invadans]|eukprot:XP_008861147.1 hypothetical protein H310_00225 [Aphanomyces invadans]